MPPIPAPSSRRKIPTIVPLVLSELTRRRHAHELSDRSYEERIDRLAQEELDPRNLSLLVRELSEGHTRFIIKAKDTGVVCELLEFKHGRS